ncbi:MAG: hypothetical protein KDD55_06285 [Bdellovibrionales bacterium]|nr:hypothetical protein [Bdellovibrionales bacterium]
MGDAVTPQLERKVETEISLERESVVTPHSPGSDLEEVSLSNSFHVKRKKESERLHHQAPRTPKLNSLQSEIRQSSKSTRKTSETSDQTLGAQTILDHIVTSLADFLSQLDHSLFENVDPQDLDEEFAEDELIEAMQKEQRRRNEKEIRRLLAEKSLPPEDLELVLQALELLTDTPEDDEDLTS